MSIETKVTCDHCGNEKKETNHWLVAVVENGYLGLTPWPKQAQAEGAKHLCGRECVQKTVERWLQSVNQAA